MDSFILVVQSFTWTPCLLQVILVIFCFFKKKKKSSARANYSTLERVFQPCSIFVLVLQFCKGCFCARASVFALGRVSACLASRSSVTNYARVDLFCIKLPPSTLQVIFFPLFGLYSLGFGLCHCWACLCFPFSSLIADFTFGKHFPLLLSVFFL